MNENNGKLSVAETNPREIFAAYSGTDNNRSTFFAESYLARADAVDKCPPQMIYHDTLTRVKCTIISKKTSKVANIPVRDLSDIEARTAFIRQKVYENELLGPSGEKDDLPPAYTVRIRTGKMKGKTPAQVLLENEDNKDELNQYYAFLKSKVEQYPENQKVMDAIMNAASLLKKGELKKECVQDSGSVFTVYCSGIKFFRNKKREDGKTLCYEITVKCYMNDSNPVEVEIINYYAPVKESDKRTMVVNKSQMDKESLIKGFVKISLSDWNRLVSVMREQLTCFEILNARDMFAKAEQMYNENMERNHQMP